VLQPDRSVYKIMAGLREAGIYPEYSQNDYEFAEIRQSEL